MLQQLTLCWCLQRLSTLAWVSCPTFARTVCSFLLLRALYEGLCQDLANSLGPLFRADDRMMIRGKKKKGKSASQSLQFMKSLFTHFKTPMNYALWVHSFKTRLRILFLILTFSCWTSHMWFFMNTNKSAQCVFEVKWLFFLLWYCLNCFSRKESIWVHIFCIEIVYWVKYATQAVL